MPSRNVVAVGLVAATLSAVTVNLAFPVQQPERYQQLAAEILREMVEFPSASASIEQTVVLLEAVMKRLAAAHATTLMWYKRQYSKVSKTRNARIVSRLRNAGRVREG